MNKRKSSHNQVASDRIFIGVAGGSAAGKTTLCDNINRQMAFDRNFKVQTISLDSFYKSINKSQIDVSDYNFDHPLALDFDLAYEVLQKLKYSNEKVQVPQYCFVTHQRLEQSQYVSPANIILFEGLMAFHDQRIRNMMTYKIFINCDGNFGGMVDDIRLCRRIKRDTKERGRTIVGVLAQYNKFVKNSFRDFIYPTIGYADLVIPGSRNNRISVDFIVQHIKNVARKKNIFKTAQDTKVFIFGQNQYFDMNVKKNYKDSIQITKQSFLIFPTSDQHRRQLDFFFNTLMSQAFTQQYFQQVYVSQFMKIVRSLLKQLFELKHFKTEDMQLISIFDIRQRMKMEGRARVKLVFVPIIFDKEEHFLNHVKHLVKKGQTLIIINLFCDMQYPIKIYQSDIQGLIFINLYLVANKKRLLDILSANNLNVRKNQDDLRYPKDWLLYNRNLVEKGIQYLADAFKIPFENMTWEYENKVMDICLKNQTNQTLHSFPISENGEQRVWTDQTTKRKITQIQTIPQFHSNLCGYHALHNIKQFSNISQLRSKKEFLQNYLQFIHSLQRKSDSLKYLKQELFVPLERSQVPQLIHDHQLFENREICSLYVSQNYVVNQKKCLNDLEVSLLKFRSGQIKELFLLMGIHQHFYILKFNDPHSSTPGLTFIDSLNTPISQIMSGTTSIPNPTQSYKLHLAAQKSSLLLALELYYTNISIQALLVRLRIDEVLKSYQSYKDNLQEWIVKEYPIKVLKNDLCNQLDLVNPQEIGEQWLTKIRNWLNQDFVKEHLLKNQAINSSLTRFK